MIGLAVHWELPKAFKGAHAAKKWAMLWTHTAKAFGVTDIYFVDVCNSMARLGDREINSHIIADINELPKEFPLIVVEQGGGPLKDFIHPAECIYIFGSNYGEAPVVGEVITIPTDIAIHAEIAAGIVLYDRREQWL